MGKEISPFVEQILSDSDNADVTDFIREYLKVNPTFTNSDIHTFLTDAISILERRCRKLEEQNEEMSKRLKTLETFMYSTKENR